MNEVIRKERSSDPAWSLTPRELLVIALFWTSLAGLSTVHRLIDPRGSGFRVISPVGPIALIFIEAWVWAALTPVIFWLGSRYSIERTNWPRRLILLVAAGAGICFVADAVLELARLELLPRPHRRHFGAFHSLHGPGPFRFLHRFMVFLLILAAGLTREYFARDQKREREAVELQAATSNLKAQLSEARLDALRMQINPHFLFNTLHAISALVERDPAGVRRMITRLSDLLRHTLESRGAEVSLREELSFLQRYVEIMEVRFEGRLRVEQDVAADTMEALIPNLILQPILENALEHGAGQTTGEAVIHLSARRADEQIVVTITDNGPGLRESGGLGATERVGLTNTRARLEQLYGEDATVTLRDAEGGGATASLRIPYHTRADLRAQSVSPDESNVDG